MDLDLDLKLPPHLQEQRWDIDGTGDGDEVDPKLG